MFSCRSGSGHEQTNGIVYKPHGLKLFDQSVKNGKCFRSRKICLLFLQRLGRAVQTRVRSSGWNLNDAGIAQSRDFFRAIACDLSEHTVRMLAKRRSMRVRHCRSLTFVSRGF